MELHRTQFKAEWDFSINIFGIGIHTMGTSTEKRKEVGWINQWENNLRGIDVKETRHVACWSCKFWRWDSPYCGKFQFLTFEDAVCDHWE